MAGCITELVGIPVLVLVLAVRSTASPVSACTPGSLVRRETGLDTHISHHVTSHQWQWQSSGVRETLLQGRDQATSQVSQQQLNTLIELFVLSYCSIYLILIYKYDRNDSQLRFCCSATDRILKTPDKFFDQIVDIS